MKIGILTYHRACNFGAILQTYALQKAISNCSVQCEIIDYRCKAIEKTNRSFYVNSHSLKEYISAFIHYPFRRTKNIKLKDFRDRYLIISNSSYNKGNLYLLETRYDKFVVGSDQVWNGNLTDNDPTFFLDFVNNSMKKYSYAASIGSVLIDKRKQDRFVKYLSSFNCISVRECDSSEILGRLLEKNVQCLLDPVFLHPIQHWMKFVLPKVHIRDYIFAYCLHNKGVYKFAERLTESTGLEIITIPNHFRIGIKTHKDYFAGIEQFISYICHAKYVVTDSFHAAAFCVIFHKNTTVILREETDNRLRSIMKLFCLEHKIRKSNDYNYYTIDQVDYLHIDGIKEEKMKESLNFIRNKICGDYYEGI